MLTQLLLDPLLFSFTPDELPSRLERLEPQLHAIKELLRDYPVKVAPFLGSVFVESMREWRMPRGSYGGEVARLVRSLELRHEPTTTPAEIEDQIALGETWRAVLAEISQDTTAPLWRNPVILAADMTGSQFPNKDELCYTMSDGTRRRNLVKIGNHLRHPFFERDFDPWRLRTVGPPVADCASPDKKRDSWKRLPRPAQLSQELDLQDLTSELQKNIDYSMDDEFICFVPPKDWSPLGIEQEPWRKVVSIFSRKSVQRGRRRGKPGYQDRRGRVWVWDGDEFHWDVQIVRIPAMVTSQSGLMVTSNRSAATPVGFL